MTDNIAWQKSSFSTGQTECVELAATADGILIRESDEPHMIVTTSRENLRAFVLGVKIGDFDHLM